MSLKRKASQLALARLSSHSSPYSSGVTLFELKAEPMDDADLGSVQPGPSTTRRSKRVKVEQKFGELETFDHEEEIEPLKREDAIVFERKTRRTGSSEVLEDRKTVGLDGSPKKKKAKQKPIQLALAVPHPAPERWREVYDIITDMRKGIVAPVDTMGCASAQLKETEPKNQRFATLVSLMLSSQTKDEVTDAAVANLRKTLGGAISVDALIEADDHTISQAIGKVGFWRRKTQYLKQTAERLRDDFESDVPKTVDELCSLPGVGPKMAFLALQVAWNLNVGIGVDVHVHRITNRLGWHKPPTKTPEETRLNLQSWLPSELHHDINHLLVGFGQVRCLPVGPKCGDCDLSAHGLCPSAKTDKKSKNKNREGRSRPKIEIEVES